MKTGWKVLIALGAVTAGGAGCDNTSSTATAGHSTVMVLSDSESASVLGRLNAGQVEAARVFRPLGAHSEVLGFADQLVDTHLKADGQLLALGVAEQPNAVGHAIDADTAELIAMMGRAGAVQAEGIYVNSQLAMHRQMLLLIDCAVIPGTQSEAFRGFVFEQVRPKVRAGLEAASELSTKLSGANAGHFAGAITASTGGDRCADACDPTLQTGFSVELRAAACR